jgi:hypothetical protein
MSYAWPENTDFARRELDVLNRDCPSRGRMMSVCDHRSRRVHTLDGSIDCPGHRTRFTGRWPR